MSKAKVIFVCKECGNTSVRWLGRCPDCGAWNSFIEEKEEIKTDRSWGISDGLSQEAVQLKHVDSLDVARFSSGLKEVDRILGGGIVPGTLILLGGSPGIGKSTLLLQLASCCKSPVLYVSGEESKSQIKMRADRLGASNDTIFLLSTDNIIDIENSIKKITPKILIVDSIQTICNPDISSAAGNISQVRDVTANLLRIAKKYGIAVFLIGHVTKDGFFAGPKVLEHIVDVVLYFEDENGIYRIIRCFKNRFGNTSEIAVFEMTGKGLIEVFDPEKIFWRENEELTSGTVVSCVIEGSRPITIELQALVTRTGYGIPRRQATGFDINRLIFLIAVIEKRLKINLSNQDIFVNIVGGIKIKEPSIDLGICSAILSSYFDIIIPKERIFLGEIGLGGEIRDIQFLNERLNRAKKLGIKQVITADSKIKGDSLTNLELVKMRHLKDLSGYIRDMGD
ncbi:DNA repair protein RadA [bacterium]